VKWLLDTNACIHILNGTSAPLIERFRARSPRQLSLCAVVKAELLYCARKSRRVADNLAHLERFFEPLASLPFDDACAGEYGLLRADLASRGTPIGSNDLMIAATARVHDLIVITNNVDEFSRIMGLRVEDWERP
jgi:tRNA(fMet)-specific endonuclease VapC